MGIDVDAGKNSLVLAINQVSVAYKQSYWQPNDLKLICSGSSPLEQFT